MNDKFNKLVVKFSNFIINIIFHLINWVNWLIHYFTKLNFILKIKNY